MLSRSLITCFTCHCLQLVFHPGLEIGDYDRESRKTDLKGYPPNGELNYGRSYCISRYKSRFPLLLVPLYIVCVILMRAKLCVFCT